MFTLTSINHWIVFVGAAVYVVLVRWWLSPSLFGRQWGNSMTEIEKSLRNSLPVKMQLVSLFWTGIYYLYIVQIWMLVTQSLSIWSGVSKGGFIGFCMPLIWIVMPVMMTFSFPPYTKRIMIEASGQSFAMAVSGAMLGIWL